MTTEPTFHIPADRHYDREHNVWAQTCDNGRIRIGIDAFLLSSLGELAYVALFDVGTAAIRGDSIGTLEAAKMTTSINVPISGVITQTNAAVLSDPQLINREPYVNGWLIELDPSNWDHESNLMVSGDDIPAWVQESTARLAETE